MAGSLAIPLTADAADPMEDGTRFTMSLGMGNTPTLRPSPNGTMFPPPASGPMMSNRLGVVLGPVVAFGTVGMYSGGDHVDGDTKSSRVYVPGVGLRYHFRSMAPKKASPYVVASTYMKMLQSNVEEDVDKELEDVKRSGFAGGFGGEYAFSGAFSVAGEVGIAHDIAKYDANNIVWMQVSTAVTSTVLLNFYF
jgi:hypothetical protein